MQLLPIAKGLASYVPGLHARRARRRNLQSATPEYCYEVWIKHLTVLERHPGGSLPERFAELGPGGSLGLGLSALLSGATSYSAMDIVRYSETERNLRLLDGLVELFRKRVRPRIGWPIDGEAYPERLLSEDRLERSLAEDRVDKIRDALAHPGANDGPVTIEYTVPWNDPSVVREHGVDMIVSHAVLEHVDELEDTYRAFALWLRPGGVMSHEIDFRSHGLTAQWNGHWEYPDLAWKLVVGAKPYLINRQPCTRHVELLERNGFEVTCELRQRMEGLPREKLASPFRDMSDEDLVTGTAILQSRRR